MSFVDKIKSSAIWKFLLIAQRGLLVISSIFVMLIMCLSVTLRYVFKSDLFGMEEIVVIAAFWLYFIGSSYGEYEDSHVKADIVPQLLKPTYRAFLAIITNFITAALCMLFTYWAADMVIYSFTWMARTTGLRIPIFISQSSVLCGYALMSFYALIHFCDSIVKYRSIRAEGVN